MQIARVLWDVWETVRCWHRLQYVLVLVLVLWAHYVFREYRVAGNLLVSVLPLVGAVLLTLWLVLLLNELVDVLGVSGAVGVAVRGVKRLSLLVVAGYGALAVVLWLNGQGGGAVRGVTSQVLAEQSASLGPVRFTWLTLRDWDGRVGSRRVLLTDRDTRGLYVGGDVEVLLQPGHLRLSRILEVRHDRERYYQRMLAVAPGSQVALEGLIKLYAARGEFDRAMRWLEVLRTANPHATEPGLRLGEALVDARRYREAVAVFQKILEVRRDYDVLYRLGYALAWAGQKREAVPVLREAVALDPDEPWALYSLGYVLRDTGQYAEAKTAWSKVLQMLPHFPEVERNLRAIETR